MTQRMLLGGAVLLACMLNAACDKAGSALKDSVNAQWPAVDRTTEAATALTASEQALETLGGPDLYLNVEAERLTQAVVDHLTKADPALESVEVRTDKQAIIADLRFARTLETPAVNVEGEAQLYAYPRADGVTLSFRPGAASVVLSEVKIEGEGEVSTEQLKAALDEYVAELGEHLAAATVALDYTSIIEWKPTEWLGSIPGAREVSGQQVSLTARVAGSAMLVDEAGAHLLTDFIVERAKRPTRPRAVPPEEFAERFEALRTAFRERITEAFGASEDATWSATSAAFTSEFIANSANLVLAPVSACAKLDVAGTEYAIDQSINIGESAKLQCARPYNDKACKKPPKRCETERECAEPRKCAKWKSSSARSMA